MTRAEILRRISTFSLTARHLSDELVAGDFRSVFRGQGIEFDEVRRYERGDDVRSIDWNVSARFGTPFVKLFREERELTVFLVFDTSLSMDSGGGPLSRSEQALFTLALLALSAERGGERLGAVFFADRPYRSFPARKGRAHAMAIIEAALDAERADRGSDLERALRGAERSLKRRSLVIVISDFLCSGWERAFAALTRRHDVLAIRISDPLDRAMPEAGFVRLVDPETGHLVDAPTGSRRFQRAWQAWQGEHAEAWQSVCERWRASALEIDTTEDAAARLSAFFHMRRSG